MQLTVDLPEWCDKCNIYIMAGMELAAYKVYGEDVIHVKTARCNQCGKCCMNLPQTFFFNRKEDGSCEFLKMSKKGNYGTCSLGMARPHICNVSRESKETRSYCSIEYEVRPL